MMQIISSFYIFFSPTIDNEHWWCYVLNVKEKELFVLDSLNHFVEECKEVDQTMINFLLHGSITYLMIRAM